MSPSLFTSAFLSLISMLMTVQSEPSPQGNREAIPPLEVPADAPVNPHYDLTQTHIDWIEGLDGALGRDRPILLFQLLGRFDDTFC
jgi:hypothetical protein